MGLFDKTPKYDIDLEQFETSEPNHATTFNKRVEKLIQSLEWMKENALTKAHIIRSTEIQEDGHLMDGKTLSEFLKNLVSTWDEKLTEGLRKKVDCVSGKELSSNDFTNELKEKLDQISEAANKYIHPQHTSYDSGLYKIQVDEEGHIVSAELVTKEDITELGIPGQDTNTTYGLVSTEAAGLAPRRTGTATKYLRDDGIWAEPPDTDTTYELVSTEAAGLAPRRTGTVTKYLRDDGIWEVPPDTTYGVVSTEAAGLAPKRTGTTTKYLRDDGRWEVPPNTVYGTGNASAAGIGKLYAGVGNNVDGSMTQKAISEEFTKLNKNLIPVVLFNNDSASVTSDITLSQSAANFKRMEILYKINTKSYNLTPTNVNYHSATVYNPNGKRVSLFAITRNSDEVDGLYLHSKEVFINGTKINTYKDNEYHTYRFKIEDGHAGIHADFIGITTVLGFYV